MHAYLDAPDTGSDQLDVISSLESAEHPVLASAVAAHVRDGVFEGSFDGRSPTVKVVSCDVHRGRCDSSPRLAANSNTAGGSASFSPGYSGAPTILVRMQGEKQRVCS